MQRRISKNTIKRLLDKIRGHDMSIAEKLIESLALYAGKHSDRMTRKEFREALDNAPYDDEPLTPEEEEAIQRGREDIKAGRVYPIEDVFRDHYLDDIHKNIDKLHESDIEEADFLLRGLIVCRRLNLEKLSAKDFYRHIARLKEITDSTS